MRGMSPPAQDFIHYVPCVFENLDIGYLYIIRPGYKVLVL